MRHNSLRTVLFGLLIIILTSGSHHNAYAGDTITLLYFNDAHELAPVESEAGNIGGVSRMKTLIDRVKESDPSAFVIFGGDLGGGTLGGKLFQGSVMVDALNHFPVDLASFGQHDFDYGLDNTISLIERSHFPWISSNITDSSGGSITKVSSSYTAYIKGLKIGFIGLTDQLITSGGRGDFIQHDLIQSAKKTLLALKDADFIVALTQMDESLNETLLQECPEIDLILTEETSQYKTQISFVGDVPIVAGCGNMGQLVMVSLEKGVPPRVASLPLSQEVTPDTPLEEFVDNTLSEAMQTLRQIIAVIKHHRAIDNRTKTGTLVSEAFRKAHGTDIGLIHGGGLRAYFESDTITLGDVWSVLPYDNELISAELTGEEIREIILACYRKDPRLFTAGCSVTIPHDADKKDPVIHLQGGERLDPNGLYSITLPTYIAEGGDSVPPIDTENILSRPTITDAEAVLSYLKDMSTL